MHISVASEVQSSSAHVSCIVHGWRAVCHYSALFDKLRCTDIKKGL